MFHKPKRFVFKFNLLSDDVQSKFCFHFSIVSMLYAKNLIIFIKFFTLNKRDTDLLCETLQLCLLSKHIISKHIRFYNKEIFNVLYISHITVCIFVMFSKIIAQNK